MAMWLLGHECLLGDCFEVALMFRGVNT